MEDTELSVTLLYAYDSGGAGTATKRIYQGLRKIGVDANMLVDHKQGDDPLIHGPESTLRKAYSMARPFIDRFPLRLYGGSDGVFSPNWLPEDVNNRIDRLDPDVIHLNWVGGGFLTPSTISSFDRPVVWRFPDMWPMTGGCHYARSCEGYKKSCGTCPELGSTSAWDLSRLTMARKSRAFSNTDITVVAPSNWLAECARESSLFQDSHIEVIPNGLDTDVFYPWDMKTARSTFQLNQEETIVLFGSVNATSDPRKGFDLLDNALNDIESENLRLVVFGSSEPTDPPDLNYPTTYTGYLHDNQSLAFLYSAADVMVVPSRYEGFGQTVSESMACGTPVVAFDATGPSDSVDHRKNGYLAEPYDPKDLARGINWVLEDQKRRSDLSKQARMKAKEEFSLEVAANRYKKVYKSII
ncbi:glycosyltransferase [Halorubrum sp. ASP121]|uniref:glycosyltransferase family 4 protein n=1 Tax=Halorubrum sp. ASP121 TaxID=1855858 RepID=UPI0010F75334|nr:glycosyltransferase family 4 protein [Halorubrum sp. ASP121]TKX50171.1 glycosyltransferase [Halorubrum sp. ASP121]